MTSTQRIRFWLGGFGAFIVLLYLLRGILLPFVAGMAIAYFLDPVVGRLRRIGVSRLLSTAVITLSFFALMVVSLVLLIPVIEDQIVGFAHRVPDYINAVAGRVEPLVRDILQRLSPGDVERLRSSVSGYAGTAVTWTVQLLREVLTGGLAVVNVLSLIFITPIVTFYLLRDWNGVTCRMDLWLPRDHAATIRLQLDEINRTLAGFVRGQAMVCLAMSIFYAAGLTILGVDLGLVIGLGSGILVFVPYLGHLVGLVISVSVAFAQTGTWSLPGAATILFGVGLAIEGYVLTPKLVGDKIGLHPVWILFSLLAGGAIAGFVGVLLAVPMAAVIGVLVRFGLERYMGSPLYNGTPTP
jgi:predicted PurR-regulated permease PerM